MLPEIKEKLVRQYTKITGAILTFVVIMAFLIMMWANKESSKELFLQYFDRALGRLRQETVIENSWLRETEGGQEIQEVWDNGKPLWVPGLKQTAEEKRLIEEAVAFGEKERIDLSIQPTGSGTITGVFELRGTKGERYFSKIGVVKVKGGFRSLIYIRLYSSLWEEAGQLLLWLLLFDGLGILALYLFNRRFIERVLEPVERSRRQQTEFIAAVSHELRSPLAVMKANLSAAEAMPERREDFMRIMKEECSRLASLVEDLLLLAAADAGRWHMEKEEMDAETFLIQVYESYEEVFRKQGVQLSLAFSEENLGKFTGDYKRLMQIFSILLSNALRFSEEGSRVELLGELAPGGKELRLLVRDHGLGIPRELQEKIFERFYQADRARGEKEHFGLGLSIAREIALLQGGRLFCEETRGGGATFVLSVPISF